MTDEGTRVETPLHRLPPRAWKAISGVGVVSFIVGIITLVWPGVITLVFGMLFGIFLLIRGLFGLMVGMIATSSRCAMAPQLCLPQVVFGRHRTRILQSL